MLPSAYVCLDALPLTSNGKLDRKALPVPQITGYAVHDYEPPQGETESRLAAIWAQVLKVERVSRLDNFFELGGHSLKAIRVLSRVRQELGVEMEIRELFKHPVLWLLASRILDMKIGQIDAKDLAKILNAMQMN